MRSPLLLALAAALVVAPAASAQDDPCASRGARLPAAGAWASYATDSGDFKLLYLGHETAGDRLEMTASRTMRNGEAGTMVMQMVVPAYPYEMNQVSEMVMQMGGRPPMKMSGEMLNMMRSRMPPTQQTLGPDACRRMTQVGRESVTVPAGTFQTTHYRDTQSGTDVWVDPAVPFGMVKVVSTGRTVVLKEKGTAGTTAITGTPMEMGPGMMGPPGGPGGRRPSN